LSRWQIGNIAQVGFGGGGESSRGGVAAEQFEYPTGAEILDEDGQFGKGTDEELMELIDQSGALPGDGLESSGDLSELAEFEGGRRPGLGSFVEGVACGGACLDGVGLLRPEERGAVVLVALGVAAGKGDGEWVGMGGADGTALEEVEEVIGVLPGGIEPEVKVVEVRVLLGDALESLSEKEVAVGGLGEGKFVGGGLELGVEEGSVVSVACGVDADADA